MEDTLEELINHENESRRMTFTGEEFVKIINSHKFSRALLIAANMTRDTGYETAFNVDVDNNRIPWIETVKVGQTDSMSQGAEIQTIDIYPTDKDYDKQELFGFHFHPNDEDIIIPSDEDLSYFKIACSTIGIGHVAKNGSVDMLVIKPQNTPYYSDQLEAYAHYGIRKNSDLIATLAEAGLTGAFLHLNKKGRKYSLDTESIEKILRMGEFYSYSIEDDILPLSF